MRAPFHIIKNQSRNDCHQPKMKILIQHWLSIVKVMEFFCANWSNARMEMSALKWRYFSEQKWISLLFLVHWICLEIFLCSVRRWYRMAKLPRSNQEQIAINARWKTEALQHWFCVITLFEHVFAKNGQIVLWVGYICWKKSMTLTYLFP